MKWPKGLEKPGYYENKIEGIRSSLADVAAKVNAVEKRVLADKFMDDDEKAARLIAQEKRWQKVLNKAKKLLVEIGDYLDKLRQAEEWVRETRQPDLAGTSAWQEAAARGQLMKANIDALAESGNFDQIVDAYRRAEVEGDDVLAWLLQQQGLMTPTTEANAKGKADLVTAIAELHPPDPDVLEAIEEARASLAPTYSEIEGEMGFGDEHEIRVAFGIKQNPVL